MITKKKLSWCKNGRTYIAHLITNYYPRRPGSGEIHQIAVRVGGETLYTDKLVQGTSSNQLTVRINSQSWYVKDITPIATIKTYISYDPQPYKEAYYLDYATIDLNVSINNSILLQYRSGSIWYTMLTLPADSVSVRTSGYRFSSPNKTLRIKVGDWTSSFSIGGGSSSTSKTIPPAQWGV